MKNRIIELFELGEPKSIIQREGEPISELIDTGDLVKELVNKFMEKKGYSNYTCEHGVRKDHKGNKTWDFKHPSKMLQDFVMFLKHYV